MPTVYFITNRDPRPQAKPTSFGSRFSTAGVDDLRFGSAKVSRNKSGGYSVGKIDTAAEQLDADDHTKSKILGSRKVFEELQAEMRAAPRECSDTLIYVHGYNVSFREALETGAMLADQHAASIARVAVFSWPSDGRTIPWHSYKSDRTDARVSGPAFARAFIKTAAFLEDTRRALVVARRTGEPNPNAPCHGRLHLLAHSMGNFLLRNALQEIRRELPGALPQIFDNVFLMAADEDHDTFEQHHKLADLPLIARQIHVYFNRYDRALQISDGTKGNPNRLGTNGPLHPLNVPGNVVNIDVSETVGGIVEHGYFVDDATVVADIGRTLAGARPELHGVEYRRYVQSSNRYVLLG